jgi:iron complex outermembrane receptor protein
MWMPPVKDLRNYWSPINIAKVNSRGLESRLKSSWTLQKMRIQLRSGFDLTWSTFETPLPDFGISAGEQLFYVPVENFMGGVSLKTGDVSVYYDHHWFGPSTGINDNLDAASIGSAGLSLAFENMRLSGVMYVHADNLWDVPYRVIERRPMPGRTVSVGVKFTFD